jgi:four helix bundle protein
LIAWQKAKALALAIYKETAGFPSTEKYGLTSQLRRAAVSIASNIAEGQGRLTKGEFGQFLGHARGSVHEVETQLDIAADLGLIGQERASEIIQQASEVARILNGLIDSIDAKSKKAGAGR